MKQKNISLIAGIVICTLVVLLTVVYASISGIFAHADNLPPCDTEAYSADAIAAVLEAGLLHTEEKNGLAYFYPQRAVTRGELADVIVRLLELSAKSYEKTTLGFADEAYIPETALSSVRAVLAGGYMKLYSDGAFHYDDAVPREEIADIVGTLLTGEISAGKSEKFSDFDEISEHFAKNAKKTVDYEIMIGYPDGTFRPKRALTREELALILHRLLTNEYHLQRNS